MTQKLTERMNTDLKQAMKDGDAVKRSVIRLALSAIHNAEIAKQAELSESDVLGVLAKEARQRQESIIAFKQGNRADLVSKEEAELAVLQAYLPAQASRDEITAEVKKIIQETGAKGLGDKGKVMPKVIAALKGKADGREINEVVTQLLNS